VTLEVVLSRAALEWPVRVGAMRKAMHQCAAYEGAKRPDENQERGGEDLDPWDEVQAACAEFAAAEALGRVWAGDIYKRKKTIDIPPDIEVRWTKHEDDGHLLVYNEDDATRRYVLVTGYLPAFRVHGWIDGNDAKRPEFLRPLRRGRPPGYFVPRERLSDPRLLQLW
jgi:hypothetical protein